MSETLQVACNWQSELSLVNDLCVWASGGLSWHNAPLWGSRKCIQPLASFMDAQILNTPRGHSSTSVYVVVTKHIVLWVYVSIIFLAFLSLLCALL